MRAGLALILLACAGCAASQSAGRRAEDTTYGRRLIERRCQSCHVAPDPRQFTAPAWARELGKMRRRFHLPESDWDTLLALVPGGPTNGEPQGPAAR